MYGCIIIDSLLYNNKRKLVIMTVVKMLFMSILFRTVQAGTQLENLA